MYSLLEQVNTSGATDWLKEVTNSYNSCPSVDYLRNERGYRLLTGMSADFLRQVIENSRQQSIVQNVPEDRNRRFTHESAYHSWRQEGEKNIYVLSDHLAALAGLIWFSNNRRPPVDDIDAIPISIAATFAIRIYEDFQGKGLMQPFMAAAHEHFFANQPANLTGTWLRVDSKNNRAIIGYNRFGYKHKGTDALTKKLVMARSRPF